MYAKNKNDDDDVLKCILLCYGVGPALTLPYNTEKKKYRTLKKKSNSHWKKKSVFRNIALMWAYYY